MGKYTADEIKGLGICYPQEEVEDLFMKAGIKEASAMDILKTDLIPHADKIYVCTKILPDKLLHGFACDCADRALQREREQSREPSIRSWEAVRIKRLWINGKASDKELSAARAAAGTAARTAAEAAAWAAGATEAAAWTAEAAAREAAWAAVRAAGTAAWEAERKWQVERLIKLIERSGE